MRQNLNKVPIAWANLTHNRKNLANSLAGITFAVVLMFMQIGFLNALLDSTVQMIQALNGDIFLINRLTGSIADNRERMARARVFQAKGFSGVSGVHYIHVDNILWRNIETGLSHSIRVMAFKPDPSVYLDPEINSYTDELAKKDRVIVDRLSKNIYGPVSTGVTTEIENRIFHVVGNFTLGTDFGSSGTLIMSDNNYLNLKDSDDELNKERSGVEIGMLQVEPGTDIQKLTQSMRQTFEDDILVLTKEEFIQKERNYWLDSTPVGFVFGLGTLMGFVVGTIICYQILFTDVMSRLPQFATVKAIGYPNSYLIGVVVRQSIILAALGFLPGLILSYLLYQGISWWLHLPMILSQFQGILVFTLTLVMSALSGMLAAKKVLAADPAELF